MSSIKDFKSWLLEKKETESKISKQVSDKTTEKDFSKSLSGNYEHKEMGKTEEVTKNHSIPSKAPKVASNSKKSEVETAPKKASTTNPSKPEKRVLGKVSDVQITNDKVKKSEPSTKKSHVAEMEETTKKKTEPKTEMVLEPKKIGSVKPLKTEISTSIKKSKPKGVLKEETPKK